MAKIRMISNFRIPAIISAAVAAVISISLIFDAQAFSLITDERTAVTIRGDFAGRLKDSSDFTDDGPTTFSDTLDSKPSSGENDLTLGWVEGYGRATFGSLGVKIKNNVGSTFSGTVQATSNSIITVGVPTGVAPGTPGTHTYIFNVSGISIFDYDPIVLYDLIDTGQSLGVSTLVNAGVVVNKYVDDGNGNPLRESIGSGGFLVDVSDLPAFPPGSAGTGPFNYSVDNEIVAIDVPIEYGETFALNTSFSVTTYTDSTFEKQQNSPFFLFYGSKFLNEIFADLSNSADLVAIVDSEHPGVSVTGVNFDYSHLVMAEAPAPVPVPGAVWLMLSGLVFLFRKCGQSIH